MINTDKYEGHTEGPWEWDDLHSTGEEKLFVHKKGDDNNLIAEVSGKINGKSECANAQLIADAPLLLAEVKRLRGVVAKVWDLIQNSNHEEREMFFWGFDKKNTGWLKVHEELAMKELNWGEQE